MSAPELSPAERAIVEHFESTESALVYSLNPDWPVLDLRDVWGTSDGNPHGDLFSIFKHTESTFQSATPISLLVDPIGMDDLGQVTSYFIDSSGMGGDGGVWAPGKSIATEATIILLGQLKDGRWFSMAAWNDYTGWDCQAGADFRIGATEGDVVRFGLSDIDRARLGITLLDQS